MYNRLADGPGGKIDRATDDIQKIAIKMDIKTTSPAPTPSSPQRKDHPDITHWTAGCMEDESGQVVSLDTRRQVVKEAKNFWKTKHNNGVRVRRFTDITMDVRDMFRETMENAYLWLRLCEGHWKADQIWINYFGHWKPATEEEQGTLKREHTNDEAQAGPSAKRPKTMDDKKILDQPKTTDDKKNRARRKPTKVSPLHPSYVHIH